MSADCQPPTRAPGPRAVPAALFLFAALLPPVAAQPTKTGPQPNAAVRLPDGTVVFYTKAPDDPNSPIDGVLLTPAEYKALLDQAEHLKKLKDAPKSQAPSECHIRGKVEQRGEKLVAVLTVTYRVPTSAPRTTVALGGQKALPTAAKTADGKLPVLGYGDDGLTAVLAAPGVHALTVELEAPVVPRGAKGELGFEVGLPHAPITSLSLDPPAGVKRVTVGVRERPGELRQAVEDAARLTRPAGQPLGPADLLQVVWEAPSAPAAVAPVAADAEVSVRVDEAQIETRAVLRLRGPAREWALILPPGAEATAAPAAPPREPTAESSFPPAAATLVRPTDPNRPVWRFHPPDGGGADWVVTAVSRETRPQGSKGPYPVGPLAVPTAGRLTGTVKVYAPPTVRFRVPKPPADLRRQDAPPPEEDLVAVYRFARTAPTDPKQPPRPLLEFEATSAPGFVRVQPTYTLRRTEAGWRLDAEVKVTPVRTDLGQILVDFPPGWQPAVEAGPADLVEVQAVEGRDPMAGRTLAVRLVTPQKGPLDLTLTAVYPIPQLAQEASIPLPRFPSAREQAARVTAVVTDRWEVRGTATGPDGTAHDLKPPPPAPGKPAGPASTVTAQLEKGAARADLTWQPYRPDLTAVVRAEVTLQDRQAVVSQTIAFKAAEGEVRPVRVKGPAGVTGLRVVQGSLDPAGPGGEWTLRPLADGSREFTLTLTYAVPVPARQPGPTRLAVGLFWPESATRTDATVRVWGGGSARRVARFEGPWRELPPEPRSDRDDLPWLTLAGNGASLPLALDLADPAEAGLPAATVDRALVQVWLRDDGAAAVRGRFLLRRWSPAGIDLELPAGIAPEVKVNDLRVEPVPAGDGADGRTVRVPVPEGPTRAGRSGLTLEVLYLLPPTRAGGEVVPPRVGSAVYRSPARWQVIGPPDAALLAPDPDLRPDLRWGWRNGLPAPVPAAVADEPELGPDDAGDAATLTARQPVLGPVRLIPVRRGWWVGGCSLLALVVGYGLSRLRPVLLGPALAVLGVGAAVAAAVWPQPAAQAAAGAVPGFLCLGVVLAALAAAQWYHRRRVVHLPGFTLARPEPSATGPTAPHSSGNRPVPANGSAVVLEGTGSSHPPLTPSGS